MQIILLPAGSPAAISLAQAANKTKISQLSTTSSDLEYDLSGDDSSCFPLQHSEQPARKRQRLDHLTEQEKQYRRYVPHRLYYLADIHMDMNKRVILYTLVGS